MGIMGFINFLFLIDSPEIVGMQHEVAQTYQRIDDLDASSNDEEDLLIRTQSGERVSLLWFSFCVISGQSFSSIE